MKKTLFTLAMIATQYSLMHEEILFHRKSVKLFLIGLLI